MESQKGLLPSRIVPDKWWETPLLDPSMLKETNNEILLIVGDATNVLDDLAKFIEVCPFPFDTMCINYSVKIVPWEIQHFIAGDSHMYDMQKIASDLPDSCLKHCWNPSSIGFNVRWLRNGRSGWNGTTANLCIKIGILLGYTRIVLAGVPMDKTGNWYAPLIPEDDIKQGKDHTSHLWKWNQIAARPISRLLRSMSGNTAELLGKPTAEWIMKAINLTKEIEDGERKKTEFERQVRARTGTAG